MKAESEIKKTTSNNHKKQFLLEILLPIIVSAILLLILFIITTLAVAGNEVNDSRPVDIAIILIMAISLTLILISLIIILVLSNLLHKANHSLPQLLMNLQQTASRVSSQISQFAMISSFPMIKIKSVIAGMDRFLQSTRMKK